VFEDKDLQKIAHVYHTWRNNPDTSLTLLKEGIKAHGEKFPSREGMKKFPSREGLGEGKTLPGIGEGKWLADLGEKHEDVAGFCKTATLEEVRANNYVLSPGRYVGTEAEEDDGVSFEEKMQKLTAELMEQFEESDRLEEEIKKNLSNIGYR